ncbi:MAG: mesJ [Rickettsiaceae bacterium]|jgi:tRNA(Ile)-lysidine synthase|nr:mesJ [Rickettsiaceae bacterium]
MENFSHKFSENLNKLYPFKRPTTFAVAVSGGADSLALLVLAKKWAEEKNHKIVALTVDHGLRSESAAEAEYVAKICKQSLIEHYTLKWEHSGVTSNIQEAARAARYELLTEFCKSKDILHILTAHHADDKLENFFIRLSRGSGLMGFAEHNIHYYNSIEILRPFYNFTKDNCYQLLQRNKIKHIEDPSNDSNKYLRSELRGKMQEFFNLNNIEPHLYKQRILSSIENLSLAAKTVEQAFTDCLVNSCTIHPEGFAKINLTNYVKFSGEEKLLTLSHILTVISGQSSVPRYDSVKQLYIKIIENNTIKSTLHGCSIHLSKGSLCIFREYGKNIPEKLPLQNGAYWDNRYYFSLEEKLRDGFYIEQCSDDNFKSLSKAFKETITLPPKIIFTLPTIKSIEKLVAIPHINYYSLEGQEYKLDKILSIKFKPSFISRLTHYVF